MWGEGDGFSHPSSRGQALRGNNALLLHQSPRRGWVHASAEDNGWVHRIRGDNGWGGGWVCTPILTFPPQGGREGEGWVHASARITGGGWVQRIRGDNGWGWVHASAKDNGWGMGPRIREGQRGEGDGSILTFPPQGGREGEGWVPTSAGTTGGDGSTHPRGQRVGMGPRIRLHGGRLYARTTGGGWIHASAGTTDGRWVHVGAGTTSGGWGYSKPRRSRAGITWARLVTVAWGSSSVGGW